jgi:WD40 repeat protein
MAVMRRRWCVCIVCAVLAAVMTALLLFAPPVTSAADDPPKPAGFISDVAPILKEHCMACHNSRKRAGKFDMTTFASLRTGGAHDDPIVAGKPDESALIERLTADGPKRMPPPPNDQPASHDGALPPEKIAVIERWIREGAKLETELTPETDVLRELRKRWQPPTPPMRYAQPTPITALAFSPDGARLIAGGRHELTVWNALDGRLLARVRTRAERTYAVVFLADNRIAVAGGRPGQEGDVRVYDLGAAPVAVENGVARLDGVGDPKVLLAHLVDSDDCILCLAVNSDRTKLAAGGCDRQIRVWDLGGGPAPSKLEQTFEIHSDWVLGVAFAPDGQRLFTASRDKSAKIWDLAKKEPIQSFPDHQRPVFGVAVRKDGAAGLSVGADKMLRIWNADGAGKPIKSVGGHADDILKIVPVPGQTQFVTCSADASVRLWGEDGAAIRTFPGLDDQAYGLAVTGDGTRVAAGYWNGAVRIWRVADGTVQLDWIAAPGYAPISTAPK